MSRTAFLVGVAVAVAGVSLYAVSRTDRADERGRRVVATATTASTVRTTSTTSTTSTTTAVLGDAVDPTTTTTRATVPAGCRNSNDPACGPFYWDPQPVPDRPLVIDVHFTPEQPRVGEDVVFEIVYADPDAPELSCRLLTYGDDPGFPTHCDPPNRPCSRYGPWSPPAPSPVEVRQVEAHRYAQPGTYEVVVAGTSFTPGTEATCTDSRTRRPGDPFGATVRVVLQVVVSE